MASDPVASGGERGTEMAAKEQRRRARRLIAWGLIRAFALTVGVLVLYFILPLDAFADAPWALTLTVALVVLAIVTVVQVRAVLSSANPAIRAIEGVAATAPLFIVLFASSYYVMSQASSEAFSQPDLSRMGTLYFTVTVFTTVGFGDITATTDWTQAVVTFQMVLNLILLGFVVRVFIGAVKLGQQRRGRSGPTIDLDRND
jgi:voltage-gated potassium channel